MRIIPRLNPPLRFYVASRLENAAEVSRLVHRLTGWGWNCTYDWTHPEQVSPDDGAVEIAARVLAFGSAMRRGVLTADLVVFLSPIDVEIGLAIASPRRPRMILAEPGGLPADCCVHYHYSRIEHVTGGVDEVLAHLEGEDA